MSHTSMILSGLFLLAMVVFLAPGVFLMNRGKNLRNIALWLAIILGLALVYQAVGPDSPNPLFQLPDALSGMHKEESAPVTDDKGKKDSEKDTDAGEQGFTPPRE